MFKQLFLVKLFFNNGMSADFLFNYKDKESLISSLVSSEETFRYRSVESGKLTNNTFVFNSSDIVLFIFMAD